MTAPLELIDDNDLQIVDMTSNEDGYPDLDLDQAIASIQAQGEQNEEDEQEEEQGEQVEELEEEVEEELETLEVDEDGLAPLPGGFGIDDDDSAFRTGDDLVVESLPAEHFEGAGHRHAEDNALPLHKGVEELSRLENGDQQSHPEEPTEAITPAVPTSNPPPPSADNRQGESLKEVTGSTKPAEEDVDADKSLILLESTNLHPQAQSPAFAETSQAIDTTVEETAPSPFDSPITPLPDLPTELPSFEEISTVPTSHLPGNQAIDPEEVTRKRVLNGFQDLPAESSMSASKSPPPDGGAVTTMTTRTREKRPRESATTKTTSEVVREDWEVELGGPLSRFDEDSESEIEWGRKKKKKGKKSSGSGNFRATKKKVERPTGTEPQATAAARVKSLSEAQLRTACIGKTKEVQLSTCLRTRYTPWGKCTQCIAKIGGDSCRFRANRVFRTDPANGNILGILPYEPTNWEGEMTPLPTVFNTDLNEKHILRTERTVAPLLLPLITRELRHSITRNAVTRVVDAAVHRSVCDFCSSTTFGGYFFCKICGKDFCLQCENYFPDSIDTIRDSPWPLPDAARPRLLKCTGGPRHPVVEAGPSKMEGEEAEKDEVVSAKTSTVSAAALTLSEVEGAAAADGDIEVEDPIKETSVAPQDSVIPNGTATEGQGDPEIIIDAVATLTDDDPAVTPAVTEMTPQPIESAIKSRSVRQAASGRKSKPPKPKTYYHHTRSDLQPVSRFPRPELESHWKTLVEFVINGTEPVEQRLAILGLKEGRKEDIDLISAFKDIMTAQKPEEAINGAPDSSILTLEDIKKLYFEPSKSEGPVPDPAGLEKFCLPYIKIADSELDNEKFDILWGRGEPILVDGVGEKFKLGWTPDTFIEEYGDEQCNVVDCQSNKTIPTTVAKFFQMFKKEPTERGPAVLKVKDWPSSSDFQSAYPKLYNDFCDSLPVPDYTKRNGVLNLYSHFPPGITRPDIGPKMYNAFEAVETTGGFGSTRLHMDVADAINIMLHASKRPDSQPGCAVWDLFRAEDADKIRKFLHEKFGKKFAFTDPIHSQLFYLDAGLRKELLEKFGVVSWRIYQYPGQAVFIPAGCAHQVCNLADCIKIALDFVSPHNVTRCQQLTKDFRNENFVMAWKEDVLQLYNIMWFAWTSSRQTRARREDEKRTIEIQQASRAAHLKSLQNGVHESFSPGGSILSPAVSSIRDGPLPAQSSVRMDIDSPAVQTQDGGLNGEVSNGVSNGRDVEVANLNVDQANTSKDTNGAVSGIEDHSTSNGETLSTPHANTNGSSKPPPTLTEDLTSRLLSALLKHNDPIPKPPKPSQAVRPGFTLVDPNPDPETDAEPNANSPSKVPGGGEEEEREKPRIAALIRQGALPLDLAVAAARAAMGEGGEEFEYDDGDVVDGGEVEQGNEQMEVPVEEEGMVIEA